MFNQKKIIIPKLNVKQLNEYIAIKASQTVIFDDDIVKKLELSTYREYVESNDFIISLMGFVIMNYILRMADYKIKKNIFEIISYLKNNKIFSTLSEKKILFEDLNGVICALNNTSDEKNINFYRNQYYNRMDKKRTDFQDFAYDEQFIEEKKEYLNLSIISDYRAIYDLIKVDDEQLFKREVVPNNLTSEYFLNTLNILFKEKPGLYNDQRFLSRIKFILQNNILLVKGKESNYELVESGEIDPKLVPRTKQLLNKIERISR